MQDIYQISIPRKTLQHEEMRWGYMSNRDLTRRLNKITKPEKLSAFYKVALDRDNSKLYDLAYERFQLLFNGDYKKQEVKPKEIQVVKPKVKISKPVVVEEVVSITLKRYIDF